MSTTNSITSNGDNNMPIYLGLAVVVIIVIAYFSKGEEDKKKSNKAAAITAVTTSTTTSKKSKKKKSKPKASSTPVAAPKAVVEKKVVIQEPTVVEEPPTIEEEPEVKTSTKKKKKKKKGKKNGAANSNTAAVVESPKTVVIDSNNSEDSEESDDDDDDELWRIQSSSKRKGANDTAKRAAANKERDRVRALKRKEEKAANAKADAKAKADAEAAAVEEEKARIAAEEKAAKDEELALKAALDAEKKENQKSMNGTAAAADTSDPAAVTGEKKKRKRKKKKKGANSADEGASRPTLVSGPPPVEHWETVPKVEEWATVETKKTKQSKAKQQNGAAASASQTFVSDSPPPVVEEETSATLSAGDDPLVFIGKGGATIQGLQETSGAKFHLNRATNILTIVGSEEAVQIGLAAAQSILTTAAERKANEVEEKVQWGGDAIKAVIGRGGQNIRATEDATGCKLDADVEAGTLVIIGAADQVAIALKMANDAAFGQVQEELNLGSRNAVNLVYGPNFSTIRALQESTGCKLDITRGSTILKMAGSEESVTTAKARIHALLQSNQGFSMTIENAKVGAVYGKGGETLRSIQDRTGTQIDVSRGPTHATVSVMGTAESSARARNMLQRAIDGDVEVKPGEVAEEVELGNATAAVIGRGGSNVADLENRHGVKVNVRSELQKARVVGKADKVAAAVKEINAITKPILDAETAQKKADEAVQSGESAWQAEEDADEAEGW